MSEICPEAGELLIFHEVAQVPNAQVTPLIPEIRP